MLSDDELLEIFDKSSDHIRPALRAVYEAGVDAGGAAAADLGRRMAELLDELTDGRMSKTNYDVRTMVREIEEAFDRRGQEEIVEAVAAERRAIAQSIFEDEQRCNAALHALGHDKIGTPEYQTLVGRGLGLQRARDIAAEPHLRGPQDIEKVLDEIEAEEREEADHG